MVRHDVVLAGASFASRGPAPVVLARTDDDFIANILRDLVTEQGRAAIVQSVASAPSGSRSGRIKLFQPVHHTFHVVLVEAACETVGLPRVDPRRIDSAGIVIRRVQRRPAGKTREELARSRAVAGEGSETLEAWIEAGRTLRAWQELTAADAIADPDVSRRPAALKAGHPEIDRRLALLRAGAGGGPLVESVAPLFVAPPDVCTALNRTLLYGLLPLATSERTTVPSGFEYSPEVVTRRMPIYFREAAHTRSVPRASDAVGASGADDPALRDYVGMLAQITLEFGAFRDTPAGRAVFAALNEIRLPYAQVAGGHTIEVYRGAGDELRKAAALLVERQPGAPSIRMPLRWPAVTRAQAQAISAAVTGAMRVRLADARQSGFVVGAGRFEDPSSIYRLRAFARIKSEDGCPPRLHWSPYGAPFTIAPWYDSNAAAPPAEVIIPEIKDVSKIKPNVAFKVPESVFNVLERNKDIDNLGRPGFPEIGVGWICGLNIPIITLCAFIVLNIFLQLFNIIFQWMAFVKICIPFPKVSAPADE
jgi:hypothetical protein